MIPIYLFLFFTFKFEIINFAIFPKNILGHYGDRLMRFVLKNDFFYEISSFFSKILNVWGKNVSCLKASKHKKNLSLNKTNNCGYFFFHSIPLHCFTMPKCQSKKGPLSGLYSKKSIMFVHKKHLFSSFAPYMQFDFAL